MIFRIMLSKL